MRNQADPCSQLKYSSSPIKTKHHQKQSENKVKNLHRNDTIFRLLNCMYEEGFQLEKSRLNPPT